MTKTTANTPNAHHGKQLTTGLKKPGQRVIRLFRARNEKKLYYNAVQLFRISGVPKGSRTPVTAVKGRCPRPLDDGDADNQTSYRVRKRAFYPLFFNRSTLCFQRDLLLQFFYVNICHFNTLVYTHIYTLFAKRKL